MQSSRNKGLEEAYNQVKSYISENFGTGTVSPTAPTTPQALVAPGQEDNDEHLNGVLELIKSGKLDINKLSDAIKKHQEGINQAPPQV
jgi:hypothetical protein